MKAMATTLMAGAMLSLGAMSAPVLAADSGGSSQQSKHSTTSQTGKMYHGEFAGEVLSVRTATFANGKDYKLVKIRSQQGDIAVLNIGPAKFVKRNDIDLQEGEYIMARGVSGRINGKPVLVVYSLRTTNQGDMQSSSQ